MIDWEKVIKADDIDDLKEAKLWLFRENMRLENERNNLENERCEFERVRDRFANERVKLRDELDMLNRRTVMERKRLKDENLFFEKKMAILQDGFRQLEEDRRKFDREKRIMLDEIASLQEQRQNMPTSENVMDILFRSATNPLALRKRYRDLVKIFHPDNLFGDKELAQQINKEYVRRRREE